MGDLPGSLTTLAGCFNPGLLQSALLFLNQDLGVHRCCANRANIAACNFIVIRFPHLFAVRASDNKWCVVFRFDHCRVILACGKIMGAPVCSSILGVGSKITKYRRRTRDMNSLDEISEG